MDVFQAIRERRSVKRFTNRPVTREELETLLDAAVQAPNHRMTQPWRFYMLGPVARRAYGTVLGSRKARKVEDPNAARMVMEKVAAEHETLPAMIAVATRLDENTEVREEDYAATMMAVQNLGLAAVALGLGVHIKSGAVMDDPAAREAVGVAEEERIIATLHIGEPAELPVAKARAPAGEKTVWRD
jgi:nitroreductase